MEWTATLRDCVGRLAREAPSQTAVVPWSKFAAANTVEFVYVCH